MKKLFGTDGIRGLANRQPLTPEVALRLGLVLARRASMGRGHAPGIVVGRDTRRSGDLLESALVAGICSAGGEAIVAGVLPTPAVALLVRQLGAAAGIVVSASHNAFADNGLKVFAADGFKLPDSEEATIEAEMVQEAPLDRPTGAHVGTLRRIQDAPQRYLETLIRTLGTAVPLAGLRVVMDCANGAASWVGPRLFEECGAEVVVLAAAPDGININAACGALHPETLQQAVTANSAHFGIALDGDADRVILVDEMGAIVDGDEVLAILALDLHEQGALQGNTVVATVMSNMGLEIALRTRGIGLVRTAVGDRYVVEAMRQHGCTLGGEQSGHIVLLDTATTGDGLLAALRIASIIARRRKSLSALSQVMERLPQALVNVRVRGREDLDGIPAVRAAVRKAQAQLEGQGRILIRYSGTEPLVRIMAEGPDAGRIATLVDEIADTVRTAIGG